MYVPPLRITLRLKTDVILDRAGDPVFAGVRLLQYDTHIATKSPVREMWDPLQLSFSLLPDRLCRGQIKFRRTQSGIEVLSGKLTVLTFMSSCLMPIGEVASCGCPEVLGVLGATQFSSVAERRGASIRVHKLLHPQPGISHARTSPRVCLATGSHETECVRVTLSAGSC